MSRFTTIDLERVLLSVAKSLPLREIDADNCTLTQAYLESVHSMLLRLDSYVLAMPKQMISIHRKWPKDWWQAFRERWFPHWWLRRWPVQYEELNVEERRFGDIYPKLRGAGASRSVLLLRSLPGVL